MLRVVRSHPSPWHAEGTAHSKFDHLDCQPDTAPDDLSTHESLQAEAAMQKLRTPHLSPKLGRMQVTSLPLFSGFTATLLAATTAAPQEMPTKSPSSNASRLAIAIASSLDTCKYHISAHPKGQSSAIPPARHCQLEMPTHERSACFHG